MPVFSGRIEARATIPTGGAAVSATIANGGAAVTATVPAADYYLTTAGGVSSITTALQTALNNASNGYPRTAAATTSAILAGTTWSAGWLFNIASGNDTGAFGGVTMTAVSTPTHGTAGPRAGIDKAVGFDSALDAFSAGDTHDVNATSDLLIGMVCKFTGAPGAAEAVLTKYSGATPYWYLQVSLGSLQFKFDDGVHGLITSSVAVPASGEWFVLLAAIDRGAGTMRIGTRTLSGVTALGTDQATGTLDTLENAGNMLLGASTADTAPTTLLVSALYVGTGVGAAAGINANLPTALTNFANAINAEWTVTPSTTDGRVSIGWTGYATPTWSLSWTSTVLRDALGFTANISSVTTTQVSTKQSPMVWFPDSPMNCDDHPSMTPEETDLRTSESPTGIVLGLCGNTKYVHSNLRYERVPVDRIRENSATYANASLEVFFRNTQSGQGDISWFTPASPVQVYWNNAGTDVLLGADANSGAGVEGWTIVGVSSFSKLARMSQPGWVGQFDVTFPRLVSDGS